MTNLTTEKNEALRRRVGINVRALRSERCLTLLEASERAEIYWRKWQKIEEGEVNVTVDTLEQIAEALEVDAVLLLQETPAPRPLLGEVTPVRRSQAWSRESLTTPARRRCKNRRRRPMGRTNKGGQRAERDTGHRAR